MRKIRCENDWERLSFWLGKTKLRAGDMITVKFPNGIRERHEVCAKPKYCHYDDMGGTYWVQTEDFFIRVEYKGLPLEVPLEGLLASFRA